MVLEMEPVADKWRAFGWDVRGGGRQRRCGDRDRLRPAPRQRRAAEGDRPAHPPGKGVPTIEARERAHFVRVGDEEWDALTAELEDDDV